MKDAKIESIIIVYLPKAVTWEQSYPYVGVFHDCVASIFMWGGACNSGISFVVYSYLLGHLEKAC